MIRVGTSSWADPEFIRDCEPPKLPAAARLAWYAQHFNYVEVNSSFYAIPVQKVVRRWDSETPSNFLFDVKLHGLLSRHVVKTAALPPDIRRDAETNPRGNVIMPKLERIVSERIRKKLNHCARQASWAPFFSNSALRFDRAHRQPWGSAY